MRVLSIGGNGFIGRFVTALLLEAGHDVVVFHRGTTPLDSSRAGELIGRHEDLPLFGADIARLEPDVVIDFILGSGAHAATLLEALAGRAGRLVVLSSQDVYRATGILHRLEPGDPDPVPLGEDAPLRTRLHPYPPPVLDALRGVFGWVDAEYDKIPVERAVLEQTEIPTVVLRLPMVFGPGDPLHRLFPIVKRVDDRRPFILLDERMAAWRATRGYVENVAAAVALAATAPEAAGIYNVGEAVTSELEWTRAVARAAGFSGVIRELAGDQTPAHLLPPGNVAQHWVTDSSRLARELSFKPPVSLAVGLERTIAWERAHPPDAIDPAQFDYAAEDRVAVARYLPPEVAGEVSEVHFLSSGLSGAGVYAVTSTRGDLVLRVQPEPEFGRWEQQALVMRRAAELGVAPRVLFVDQEARAIVSARAPGRPLAAALADAGERRRALGGVVAQLRALHAVDADGVGERDPVAWLRGLLVTQRARSGFPASAERIEAIAAEVGGVLEADRRRVVSHNDLNPGNIVWDGERAWLVDWEVAGLGHPYYDLAALAMFLQLDEAVALALLAEQEQTPIDSEERATFAALRQLAAALCGLTLLAMVPDLAVQPSPAPTLTEFYAGLRSGAHDLGSPRGRAAFGVALLRSAAGS
jgi:nucleoside-diphosphate-sugar epimerase/aminoglycoside phosphotransferase (APT) family kinase protein